MVQETSRGAPSIIGLAESELSKVVYYPGKSDFLLITFSPMRRLGKGHDFWGDSFAKKNDISTLSFIAKSPHWYPVKDTGSLITQVGARLPKEVPRICYGFSMGGYAALKYSRALGADTVLAFSPQYSIDPEEIVDFRFAKNFLPHNRNMGIKESDLCGTNFIVADRYFHLDRLNMRLIKKVSSSNVHFLNIPLVGHGTINLVTNSDTMTTLLSYARNPPAVARHEIRALLHGRRKSVPTYYESLALKLRRSGRKTLAQRVLDLGLSKTASSIASTIALARAAGRQNPQAAIEILKRAISTNSNPRLKANLARYLILIGDERSAEALREEIERTTGKILGLRSAPHSKKITNRA